MSARRTLTDAVLLPSTLLLVAVVVAGAARVWLKRWLEAVVNP